MTKGKKVTEREVWIMKGMYSEGMSIKEISNELSRSEATIEKHLDIQEEEYANTEPQAPEAKKKTTMFLNKTASSKKGVNVMTGAESSRLDDTRGKRQSKIVSKLRNNIHQISDDDG